MNFKTTAYLIYIFLFSGTFLKAQHQFENFQKEKTYIQTSHVFYKPGETMDFKMYVINAQDNLPATLSKVVNFELIDPSGTVVNKAKYEVKNGHAEGFFFFNAEMKGGIYRMKAYTDWMQNEGGKNFFEKEITLQKAVSPRILMKLDFPKKGYGAGDEVLADFSMRSLSNLPIPFHEADFMVMHHGEKISEGKLLTDKEGKCQLKFNLPDVLKSSDALLTVKVDFDGFTESISRNIPIVLNNIDVKFMPEGGTFINGIEQNIAFKILDEFEKPVDATLAIFNQHHEKMAEVSAYNFGMGSFLFTPKKGENYYAKIMKPEHILKMYPLPDVKEEGIAFNISKENGHVRLKIIAKNRKNVVVKGHFRNEEIYSQELALQDGKTFITLPENDLPTGICRFTIFENSVPIAERIVFTNEDRQLKIKAKPSKQHYVPREKVIVDIETSDQNGKPVSANLALSVIDDKLWTYADDKQNHIISWFLMDSELHGKIEKPQFYFDKNESKARKSLDLLMLTNGYRYFELIPEVIKRHTYKYTPEKRNPIYGIIEDENNKPVKAEVFLVEESYHTKSKLIKQVTGENGQFYFTDLTYSGNYKIIAKSFQPKQNIKIKMLAYRLNVNPLTKQNRNNVQVEEVIVEAVEKTNAKEVKNKVQNIQKPAGRNLAVDTIQSQEISEVVVTGALGMKKEALSNSVTLVRPSEINNPGYLSLLNGKVAGIQISQPSNQMDGNVMIRGTRSGLNKSALFIVDGVPVEHFNTHINPDDIGSVTVLKDAAATALYGSQGAAGVILVTSAKQGNSNIKFDLTPKTYFAVSAVPRDSLTQYASARQFAYPVYETTNTSYRFDYREVIYWNPVLETDKNGKARVEFYNSDANTTFRIRTEGISANGLLGRDETSYAAQSMISIDAKIPQYLTRTDQMIIPVVIKNNSSESKTMKMNVIVPNRVNLMESDSLITLKPLESGRLFVKIQTDQVINSNIQFVITSDNFRETAILPFSVGEKGFPNQYSIINNKNEKLAIEIPEYINGSFSSSYYIFENSAFQLFEDLERLKREPYGCFEQLSSTVYPNVFILDYLKSGHKINAETENMVIKNMKKGFQKMLSYKNIDGGFGYFNASESDVSLSAFALLEFRDLKKYIAVDQKTINNLKAFILSKKNGNGLFETRRRYEISSPYSEYAWSRNMYVVYALSKLGFTKEIEDSYEVSLKKALATKDSYQLALMSNAAFNLNKIQDYNTIIDLLNVQFENKQVNPNITFTGSKGLSAQAETLSLYMMALQKNIQVNESRIRNVADALIEYNGYYGFGSTQGTSLALEALSEFFSKNEKMYGTEKPVITVNNAVIIPDINATSAYKTGKNEIIVDYPMAQKGLPYKLEYQYYSMQPPKSSEIPIRLETKLKSQESKVGETDRMTVTIKNKINNQLPMVTAKIGIPSGLTLQNALLKDLMDKKQVSYYEIFDNYLVLYWEHFDANETKTIHLDLKAEFAGEYTGKSSNAYLYYMPEAKYWNEGIRAKIEP
ncbi:TonB-dependent receptor plug domain-containing protein [Chryseobacterium sp. SSA4.19]|uniref:TonB-dependent receptor plug domain-containing protein n=1 Tax=Chryseobacterium sp. SSA4.19 TaxID=2919915 RepID=UPI001F4DA8A6|nr:TonB-dependent receptor plug domain-containing protein [Chryseobacterium sp. SSA4.19]MCJ8155320.1 TonB-dependent receptor plug domain-containing protein [Chryseobacterium sp. SSA4.19]